MKKKFKQALASFLIVLMALTSMPLGNFILPELNAKAADEPTPESCFTYRATDTGMMITGFDKSVTDVVIPETIEGLPVTKIYDEVFLNFKEMKSVVLPSHLEAIYSRAFKGTGITSIVFPKALGVIDDEAFYGSALESVEFADEYEHGHGWQPFRIGNNAFGKCDFLTSINIPEYAGIIGAGAFSDCDNLKSINVDSNNISYCSDNGILFNKDKSVLVQYTAGIQDTDYSIPEGVTEISPYAFYGVENIKNITLPRSLLNIRDHAFGGCVNLADIVFSENVKSIGDAAFIGCDSFINLYIPEGVEFIGELAFGSCDNLKSAYISDSVKGSLDWTFGECSNLEDVYIGNGVSSLEKWVLNECVNLKNLTIGKGLKKTHTWSFDEYDNLENVYYLGTLEDWCKIDFGYYTYVNGWIASSILSSAKNFYIEGELLENLVIPDNITTIKSATFNGYDGLKTLVIPEHVTDIEKEAFFDCDNLTSIEIYNPNLNISSYAFGLIINQYSGASENPNTTIYSHFDSTAEEYSTRDNMRIKFDHLRPYPLKETVINSCLEEGKKIYDCDECSFHKEETVPAIGSHTFSEWIVETESTIFYEGLKKRTCSVCGFEETEAIPKQTGNDVVDPDSGVHMIFPDHTFDDEIQFEANHINNADLYNRIQEMGFERVEVFDVNVYRENGDKVQPNGKVLVKVPAPEGFDGKNCSAYYIPASGKPQRIPSYYQDGYIYFETDHFSYYAIVDESSIFTITNNNAYTTFGKTINVKVSPFKQYKQASTVLGVKPNDNVQIKSVRYELANWSAGNPEANITENGDGTATITPNGRGIGGRSVWVKVTVEDYYGNTVSQTVKVRFYKWNWQMQ